MSNLLDFLVVALGATGLGFGLVYALRTRSFLGWWLVAFAVALIVTGLRLEPIGTILLAVATVTGLVWLVWSHRRATPSRGPDTGN